MRPLWSKLLGLDQDFETLPVHEPFDMQTPSLGTVRSPLPEGHRHDLTSRDQLESPFHAETKPLHALGAMNH